MSAGLAGWSDGYAADDHYTAGHYPQIAPDRLNLTCVLQGVMPPTTGPRFNYFEMGCGFGVSAITLAGLHPEAQFFANDFMPVHIAAAQDMRRESGVSNLSLYECAFAELADGRVDLPQMDYIALHGVFSWVSAEVRAQIVRFIGRYLKPGGVVYVSYNAMPGWAAAAPLQRLFSDVANSASGTASGRTVRAKEFVMALAGCGAAFFDDKPDVARRVDQMRKANDRYLMHEYMNKHWHPMFHSEAAHELAEAKLEFVGSSILALAANEFLPEQQALLDTVGDPVLRETVADFILGTGFRSDVYARGRRMLSPQAKAARLRGFVVAPALPLKAAELCLEPMRSASPEVHPMLLRMVAGLMHGPQSIGELADSVGLAGHDQLVLRLLACLSLKGLVHFADSSLQVTTLPNAPSVNRVVAARACFEDSCQSLAAPVARNGIETTALERAVFSLLDGGFPATLEGLFHELLRVIDESEALRDRLVAELGLFSEELLRDRVEGVLGNSVPLWRTLGVIA